MIDLIILVVIIVVIVKLWKVFVMLFVVCLFWWGAWIVFLMVHYNLGVFA